MAAQTYVAPHTIKKHLDILSNLLDEVEQPSEKMKVMEQIRALENQRFEQARSGVDDDSQAEEFWLNAIASLKFAKTHSIEVRRENTEKNKGRELHQEEQQNIREIERERIDREYIDKESKREAAKRYQAKARKQKSSGDKKAQMERLANILSKKPNELLTNKEFLMLRKGHKFGRYPIEELNQKIEQLKALGRTEEKAREIDTIEAPKLLEYL